MSAVLSGAAGFGEASARIPGEISLLRQVCRDSDLEEPQRIRAGRSGRVPSAELSREEVGVRFRRALREGAVREPFRGNQREGRKEQRQREDRRWTAIFDRAKKEAGALSARWIDEISEMQSSGFMPYLKRRDREAGGNLDEAERLLMLGARILDALPAEKGPDPFGMTVRYLAVFAAEITGNPHAFDAGTKDGKYLEMLVEWYVRRTEAEAGANGEHGGKNSLDRAFPAFRKQKLFLKAGILSDDVSNYALAAGIRACDRRGKPHAGMEGFLEEGEPVQIPLSVIAGWKSASCPGKRMYIVENPSVYAVLCGKWDRKCGLMCMNGQPRFSSLLLLDLLAQSGTEVWYGGDIDPEGLLIAQRLKQYYQGEFHCWHMSADDYEMSMSAEEISQRRQKMLEKVEDPDPELKETAEALQKSGKAGYQENMLQVYLEIFRRDEDRKGEES